MFIADIPDVPPRAAPIAMTRMESSQLIVRAARTTTEKRGLSPIILPPQNVSVMIAQANQAQAQDVKTTRTVGVCKLIPNGEFATPPTENRLGPTISVGDYLHLYERQLYEQHKTAIYTTATVTILQQPKHGILQEFDKATGGYIYLPEKGYFGKDSITALVDIGGIKVKVVYFFQVLDLNGIPELEKTLCKKGIQWKISTTSDANGNLIVTSADYQSPLTDAGNTTTNTAALASTLGMNFLGNLAADTSGITLTLADLPASAIGQTVGQTITLDLNAAGHNWFVDATPGVNEEYLPNNREQ